MGISFSTQTKPPSKLVDVVINIPQFIDDLEPADIRRLSQVNRDLYAAVDHPAVWRGQFAKLVGIRPRNLPNPRSYNPVARKLFKMLCHGVSTTRHMAATHKRPTNGDIALMETAYDYLNEHFPQSCAALNEIVRRLQALEAAGKLPAWFWMDLLIGIGTTATGAGSAAVTTWGITHIPEQVAAPETARMARLVQLLGVNAAKVSLYTLFGTSVAGCMAGAHTGICIAASAITNAKEHCHRRKREMRELHGKDLVMERRWGRH